MLFSDEDVGLIETPEAASARLKRPSVDLGAGQVGTVRSIGVGDDRGEWVIPTIVDGRAVSNDEAIQLWRSGRNNPIGGPFNTVQEANDYAQRFHLAEENRLGNQQFTDADVGLLSDADVGITPPAPSAWSTVGRSVLESPIRFERGIGTKIGDVAAGAARTADIVRTGDVLTGPPTPSQTIEQRRRAFVSAMRDPRYMETVIQQGADPLRLQMPGTVPGEVQQTERLLGPWAKLSAIRQPETERARESAQSSIERQKRLEETSGVYQWGKEQSEFARRVFKGTPDVDNTFISQLAESAGGMLPDIALSAVPVAGPAMAAGSYGLQAGEQQAQEAVAAGKPEAADIAFVSAAGLGFASERMIGIAPRFWQMAKASRLAGIAPQRFAEAWERWATANPVKAGILEGSVREGVQEGTEQAGQNLIASDLAGYDPDRPTGQGVGRAAALGATMGAVAGGAGSVLSPKPQTEQVPEKGTVQQPVQQPVQPPQQDIPLAVEKLASAVEELKAALAVNQINPGFSGLKPENPAPEKFQQDIADTLAASGMEMPYTEPAPKVSPEEWEQLLKPDPRRDLRDEGVTPENIEALLSGKKTAEQVVDEQLGIKRSSGSIDASTMIVDENPDGSRSIGFTPDAGPASSVPINVGEMSHADAIAMARQQGVDRIYSILKGGEQNAVQSQENQETQRNVLLTDADVGLQPGPTEMPQPKKSVEELAWEQMKADEAAFLRRRAQKDRKPVESFPALVKRLGRQQVQELIGEWDRDAILDPEGTAIKTYADTRNRTGLKRVSARDFLLWYEDQQLTAPAGGATIQPGAAAETITGQNEQTGSEVPTAATSAVEPMPAEGQQQIPQTPRPASKRPYLKPRSDGVPDILDSIQELGGIRPPGKFSGGEYDGYREAMKGAARVLINRGAKHGPDTIISELRAMNAPGAERMESADDVWDAITGAVKGRDALRRTDRRDREEGKQVSEFQRRVIQGQRPKKEQGNVERVSATSLLEGDVFEAQGHKFEVKRLEFDPDGNLISVEVKDGPKFGVQRVDSDEFIHIDKGSFVAGPEHDANAVSTETAPAEAAAEPPTPPPTPKLKTGQNQGDLMGSGDVAFNLYGERGSDGDRIAREKAEADRRQKEAEEFAKKNQPDLLDKKLSEWIEKTDLDSGKALEGVTGAPVWLTKSAVNGVLRIVRAAYRGGKSLAQAINEGIKWLQSQNLKGYDEAAAREWLNTAAQKQPQQPRRANSRTDFGARDPETRLKITRLQAQWQQAVETAKQTGDWSEVQRLNSEMDALINAPDSGDRINTDIPRSKEETADLISATVDSLNMALDAQSAHKARGEAVPSDLTKLIKDLKTRLNLLKGWADDAAEMAAAGTQTAPAPATPAERQRQMEVESATDPEHKTFGEFLDAIKRGLRYFTSPIPELPLTGEMARKSAVFRRGYRLFAAETNRVKQEAAEKIQNVLEPIEKLGRPREMNDALREYMRLGDRLQRARKAGNDARADKLAARMSMLEKGGLDADPFNLFRRLVLYRDLWWRGTFLKSPDGKPLTLPNGLTIDDVAAELRRLTDMLDKHPQGDAIKEALRRHYALTNELQKSVLDHGEIIPEALRNPMYFPHHILDNWTGSLDRVRPSTEEDFRRYLIAPVGSGKLIQSDYLKAMYVHTADVLAHNARVDLVQKYWQSYDISKKLKEEYGEDWNKPWNLPPGYKLFSPFKKLPLRMDYILSREVLADKLGVLFNDGDLAARAGEAGNVLKVKPEDLHAAMVAGEKIQWALPAEIADALEGISRREAARANPGLGHTIGMPARALINFWKKTKLFAPWNYIRYEYGNTLTDVVDKVAVADPKMAGYLKRAAMEILRAHTTGKKSEEFKAASREGVFETITAGEAGELERLPDFNAFQTTAENTKGIIRKFVGATTKASRFREGTFRYAKFLADVDRMRAGKEPVYAGAYHEDIRALDETPQGQGKMLEGDEAIYAKAAEISLKTFGDYNSLSVISNWLRQYAVPFWSWQDVNFRYHANALRNIADGLKGVRGGTPRQVALKYAAVRVISTLVAVGLAKELWNQFGGAMLGLWDDDDDLERNLSEADRRRPHLIMGKDENGKTLVVYTPSAFGDVAEWVGGNNAKRLTAEYLRGDITLQQFISDYAKQLPRDTVNKIAQSIGPLGKAPYEAISGKSVFPDVTDQRTIPSRDRWWRVAGTMTDDRAVNWLRQVFDKDYYGQPANEQLQQMILQVRRRDPEQWAYYEARERAADWKEQRTGKRYEAGDYNAPEAQVLRNFRRAIYRADVGEAERFYQRLLELGYTADRLDASIRNQDPLSDLNKEEREQYLATLDPKATHELDLAKAYYDRLKAFDKREKQLFPTKAQMKQGTPQPANTNLLREIIQAGK